MSDLRWWIEHGDALEVLKCVPDGSVDAVVTDPPAGISFMGREWDSAKGGRDKWIEWLAQVLRECRRVLKPGGYGWVWSLPRTSHWTGMACELAGFEVRDTLDHVFGTGLPKSRALLKPAKEVWWLIKAPGDLQELRIDENRIGAGKRVPGSPPTAENQIFGARPASAALKGSDGYNPNVGRWPANFALSHSDKCVVVGTKKVKTSDPRRADGTVNADLGSKGIYGGGNTPQGLDKPRYCDENGDETVEAWQCAEGCPVRELDEQSGITTSPGKTGRGAGGQKGAYSPISAQGVVSCPSDRGGASRFFYVAKPSTRERSAGLDGDRNTHTTVKSVALMEHLVSLIAAPGDLILDPFTGSGSTGIAALNKSCRFVGVEQDAAYVDIARRRLYHAATSSH